MKSTKLTLELLSALRFVLNQAEEMGCNCASSEQINRGHNKDCPANQRNHLFRGPRKVIAKAEKASDPKGADSVLERTESSLASE